MLQIFQLTVQKDLRNPDLFRFKTIVRLTVHNEVITKRKQEEQSPQMIHFRSQICEVIYITNGSRVWPRWINLNRNTDQKRGRTNSIS